MKQPFEQFEDEFGAWVDRGQNVVACSSGTAALHLALETLDLPPGSRVLVPDLTMVACARAVTLAGLEPVFVDCNDDGTMNVDLLKYVNDLYVHAVMPVHVYGRRCDMETLHLIAGNRGWRVIEDMAEIHGVKPHTLTHAACYSFYKNKIIHGEEGGAIVFNEVWGGREGRVKKAKSLRSLGFTDDHDFTHVPRGHNYRMSNAHASLCLDSLHNYSRQALMRWGRWDYYDKLCPAEWRRPRPLAPWVYDLRIRDLSSEKQTAIVRLLNSKGIAARHCFKPMSNQEEYRGCARLASEPEGTADRLSREIIYLPLGSFVEDGDVIFDMIKDTISR